MNKLILISLIIISFSSCNLIRLDTNENFKNILFNQLYKAKTINFSRDEYLNADIIQRPFNTRISIFKISNDVELYFKVPSRNRANGVISLVNKNGDKLFFIKEISNFKIKYFLRDKESKASIKPHSLHLSYTRKKKNLNYTFPLYNVNTFITQNRIYELNDSSASLNIIKGLSILDAGLTRKLIGNKDDSYVDSKITFCHRVDKFCNNQIKNICNDCRYGFYEVVDFSCTQGGSKICGVNECGKKGMPACIRSGLTQMSPILNYCYDGSSQGFCGPGLVTVCDGRGILICL